MKSLFICYSLALVSLFGALSTWTAADEIFNRNWPQWRGPRADGIVPQGNPPLEWSETKNIQWKVAIPGEGHATPIIWEDKIFILTAVPTGRRASVDSGAAAPPEAGSGRGRGRFGRGGPATEEFAFTTLCLDRQTGRVLWQQVGHKEIPHEARQPTNTYCSGSPVTDGQHVISFFGSRGLFCYDLSGQLIWQKDLGEMRTRNGFGEGSSPALDGNILIVLWDTEEDSFLYAFDKRTGRELWKRERNEPTTWSTPYIFEHQGKKQVVVNATNAVRCYDLHQGSLLWECSGQTVNAVPSIVADQETIYAMSGYRGSSAMAIKKNSSGNVTGTDAVRWALHRGTPYVPSPLLYDGLLYFCQLNSGILTCVDAATGEAYFTQERLEAIPNVYASPVGVNGRIYLSGREGTTVVLEKGKKINILAVNKLDDSIDASPAIAGSQLFLRGHRHLYCIAEN